MREKSNTKKEKKEKKIPLDSWEIPSIGDSPQMKALRRSSYLLWRTSGDPLITKLAQVQAIQFTSSQAAECEKKKMFSLNSMCVVPNVDVYFSAGRKK